MNKILKIVRREFVEIVRKKSFLIGLFLVPVFVVASILVPVFLARVDVGKQKRIAVVDRTGILYGPLEARLDERLEDGRPEYLLQEVRPGPDLETTRRQLTSEINAGKLDAYLVVPPDIFEKGEAGFYGKNVSDIRQVGRLRSALTHIVVAHRLAQRGLDPEEVREWTRRVQLQTLKIVKGKEKKSGFAREYFTSFAFAMLLYMVTILYGIMVMRGVLEEKSTRMVEVMLSSVDPMQMMAGKILGIGAASLVQVTVWIGVGLLATAYGRMAFGPNLPFAIETGVVIYFGIYFILGYFLYATLYAIIGAICDTEQDAQHLQILVIVPMILSLLAMTFITRQPNAAPSVVMSLIPFFAPMIMIVRVNVLTPPMIEIAASVLILIGTIAGVMWAAGRIYRVGILMRGKRATLSEMVRWIRHG